MRILQVNLFMLILIFSCNSNGTKEKKTEPSQTIITTHTAKPLQVDTVQINKLLAKGKFLFQKEKYDSSLIVYEEARTLFGNSAKGKLYIDCLNNLNECYIEKEFMQQAIDLSAEISSSVEESKNDIQYITYLYNKARIEFKMTQYEAAKRTVLVGLNTLKHFSGNSQINLLELKYNTLLEDVYFISQLKQKTIQISESNLNKVDKIQDADLRAKYYITTKTRNIRDSLYLSSIQDGGLYVNIEKMLYQLLDTAKYYSLLEHSSTAEIYDILATCYHYKKWFTKGFKEGKGKEFCRQKAIEYYTKSLNLRKNIYGEKHSSLASSLNGIAIQKEPKEAIELLKLGCEFTKNLVGEKDDKVALLYNNIGRTYGGRLEQFDSSLVYFHKSIMSLNYDLNNEDYFVQPSLDSIVNNIYLLEILEQKAYAFRGKYLKTNDIKYLKYAFETLETDSKLLASMQNQNDFDKSSNILSNDFIRIYANTLKYASELYDSTKNMSYIKRAYLSTQVMKSNVLLDQVRQIEIDDFGEIPKELIEERKQLYMKNIIFKNKIRESTNKKYDLADNNEVKVLKDSLLVNEVELLRCNKKIEKDYPNFFDLLNPKVHSVSQLQKEIIRPDEVILEYFNYDKQFFGFAITQDNFSFCKVDSVQVINASLDSLYQCLISHNSSKNTFIEHASMVYDSLVEPFEHLFADKKITVIPDGKLWYVPLEILLSKQSDADWIDLPYLFRKTPVSYAYSTSFLNSKSKKNNSKNYLAFAPFTDSTYVYKESKNLLAGLRSELKELPFTEKEVKHLSNSLKGQSYFGAEATESLFKDIASNFSVLHLATHAVVNDENSENSYLAFKDNKQSDEDGLLTISEIYGLGLKSDMAVLSACNTGYGKILRGEGVMSMGRAFIYAGCSSVVMSLWQANDHTTADLMMYFYDELDKGSSKDIALQNAKLKFLSTSLPTSAHPFYWSQMIIIGETNPLENNNDEGFWNNMFSFK